MLKYFTLTITVLLLLAMQVVGQEFVVTRTDSTAKIDGLVYFIHKVKPKETLFSIAKVYEVKLSRVAFDNPGVLDGLKLDQYLRILKSAVGETREDEKAAPLLDTDGQFVLYTVPKQKTLYSISKEFNTSITAIVDANPELAEGLKVGSTIRIPVPKMLGNNQKEKVDMVGLPSMVKKETIMTQAVQTLSSTGKITLLLPLHLEMNDTSKLRSLPGEPEKIYDKSDMALQFYEGFVLALDTLKALGYDFKVKVIDTENRPLKIEQLIEKGGFSSPDIIIGPFYSRVFSEAAQYAYQHCIPIVSPTIKGSDIINNPYVFKLLPSDEMLTSDMGRYLALSDSTNNMILHYGSAEEQSMVWRFKSGLEGQGARPAKFPTYDINKMGVDSVKLKLSSSKRNNLVILTNNQVRLAGLLRKLSGWTKDYRIVVFAPNSWRQFKNLEIDHFNELRVHMSLNMHVDYEQPDVQQFVHTFREKFNAEPSSFAFRGYDLAMHFVKNLNGIKNDGVEFMETVLEKGLQSEFRWKRIVDGGFENTRARIVDHTDLNLKLATD